MIDIKFTKPRLAIVLRQAGRIVTIGTLCCAIGLHWVAIQSFAWTSMLIQNSKGGSFCQAIAQTFDGAHPCSLCRIVAKGKDSEKKSDIQSPFKKIDIIYVTRVMQWKSPFVRFEYTPGDFSVSENEQSPPVPPPRSFLS